MIKPRLHKWPILKDLPIWLSVLALSIFMAYLHQERASAALDKVCNRITLENWCEH